MFNVRKKDTRKTYHIYSKLSIKTPEQNLVLLLLLTLNIFCFLSYCYDCWTNKCCLGLRKYSFRQQICFQQLWEILYPMDLEICWDTCFHPNSYNIRLWKDKCSWQRFKKIKSNPAAIVTFLILTLINVKSWPLLHIESWNLNPWLKQQ